MFGFIKSLMGEIISSGTVEEIAKTASEQFKDIINIVVPIILGVVLLIGVVYSIILGVNYSKAEDADKRKTARERLVGAIVGFVITLVLILVIYAILSVVPSWF